jgi:glycosyltransferase involved in cell wall biosynthesis
MVVKLKNKNVMETKKVKKSESEIYQRIDDISEDFLFLVVGHALRGIIGHDRKDIWMTIKTFATVFQSVPKDKRPALLLKTSSAGFSYMERDMIQQKIDDILKPFGIKCPSVYLLYGDLSDSDMASVYHHPKVKAMVSFTKGEGYGRPLAEFALTGKPIIVSNWSAQTEFLPKENTVFLDGTLIPVHPSVADQFLMKESQWFSVNYSMAGSKMYDVYKNYNIYLEKSKGLRSNMLKNFTLDKMHELFTKILSENVKEKPKVVPFTLPKLNKIS